MPSPVETRELVDRQVRRAIRAIMEWKEDVLDPHLPPDVSTDFRKGVIDELNELGAVVAHIAESAAAGYELNELAQDVRALRAELERNGKR